jgi:Ca-activated chloride channel family protein
VAERDSGTECAGRRSAVSWIVRAKRRLSANHLLMALLTLSLTATVLAQSGRRQESKPKPAQPSNGTSTVGPQKPVAVPTLSPSPTSTGDDIEESDVVRISSNLVPIPVSVVDNRGLALTTLKLDDFELWVDGQPRPLSDLSRSETPVRLAMLFDNSGSLDFARSFEKHAAQQFFRRVLRPSDEAAIYSVESDSYLAQPMTNDVRRLEQTIEAFGKPEGSTSLFDAIISAAAYLRPYSGRRVIVIVSDGIETTSRADFETTLRQVLADDCQVFVVQTGLYEGANLRALAAERRMEQLAAQTGGAAYIPKTTSALDSAFKEIAADLAQQYILSYYHAQEIRDGRFHLIDLRIKSRKDVRVRARKGYYSPKGTNVATRNQ